MLHILWILKNFRQIRESSPKALIYVDAVHYAPHLAIDVQTMDCDFCVCSTFKFFGPHCGMLFGKESLMRTLRPYKLSVCADTLPGTVWSEGFLYKVAPPELKISPIMYFVIHNSVVLSKILKIVVAFWPCLSMSIIIKIINFM